MKLFSILGLASVVIWCSSAEAQTPKSNKLPEIIEARKVIKANSGSCADIAKLRTLANSAKTPSAKIAYEEAAQERQGAAVEQLGGAWASLRKYTRDSWWHIGDQDDGTHSDELSPGEAVDSAKSKFEAIRGCVGDEKQEWVDKMIADLEAFRSNFAGRLAKETKCRKTAPCKAKRLALRNSQELCQLYNERSLFEQIIAEEKQNPSGIVDLARLHSAGASIQQTDAQIKEAKAAYLAKVKAQFNRAICKDLPIDKETGDYSQPPETVTLESAE